MQFHLLIARLLVNNNVHCSPIVNEVSHDRFFSIAIRQFNGLSDEEKKNSTLAPQIDSDVMYSIQRKKKKINTNRSNTMH